ncbi:hypothetical protein [Nocardia salmonicida]|uniref:hypothetical protein n=1 Tax=Nocardia salmonicida TaxID=53431 RepID=UPI0012F5208B|nr:hypothetical protein [Nocardia salmonicida]MBC7299497.1 hypothetical protein [Nocardia sp.]
MRDHIHDGARWLPEHHDDIDGNLLGKVFGAALDQCRTCEETMLAELSENSSTTEHLLELACTAVIGTLGGLPNDLVDIAAERSPVPIEFRRAALTFVHNDRPALTALCHQMTPAQRHAASRTATALYTGEARAGNIQPT